MKSKGMVTQCAICDADVSARGDDAVTLKDKPELQILFH